MREPARQAAMRAYLRAVVHRQVARSTDAQDGFCAGWNAMIDWQAAERDRDYAPGGWLIVAQMAYIIAFWPAAFVVMRWMNLPVSSGLTLAQDVGVFVAAYAIGFWAQRRAKKMRRVATEAFDREWSDHGLTKPDRMSSWRAISG